MPQDILNDNSGVVCKGTNTGRCPVALRQQAIAWTKFLPNSTGHLQICGPTEICTPVANALEIRNLALSQYLTVGKLTWFLLQFAQLTPVIWHDFSFCKLTSLCNPRDHCTHSLFQDYCIVKLITPNRLTYLHTGTTLWRGIVLYALVPKTMHGIIVGKRVRTRRLSDSYCTRVWMSGIIWCDH